MVLRWAAPAAEEEAPLRVRVYEHIRLNPAAHILEMAERFGVTHPTVMYHLDILEQEGYVESLLWGKRRAHFDARARFTRWEKEVLALLAVDEARAIFLHIAAHPGTYPREIARDLGVSDTTVKRYVPELRRLHALREEEGSFRRRLWVSPGFKRRVRGLAARIPPEARPLPHLATLAKEDA